MIRAPTFSDPRPALKQSQCNYVATGEILCSKPTRVDHLNIETFVNDFQSNINISTKVPATICAMSQSLTDSITAIHALRTPPAYFDAKVGISSVVVNVPSVTDVVNVPSVEKSTVTNANVNINSRSRGDE